VIAIQHFDVGERRIAYRLRAGASPILVFLPGYASDMEGAKALALDAFAERRGFAMLPLAKRKLGSKYRFRDLIPGRQDLPLLAFNPALRERRSRLSYTSLLFCTRRLS